MKVILDEELINMIWNRINNQYKFCPSVNKAVIPFKFDIEYVCYKLNSFWDIEQEKIVNNIFKKLCDEDIYALDWQHDCFEYNPNENIKLNYHYYDDNRNVEVYFPSYYPNGDYHFFISKDFEYGMFGHPWREELYVFGEKLIDEFKKEQDRLDITR